MDQVAAPAEIAVTMVALPSVIRNRPVVRFIWYFGSLSDALSSYGHSPDVLDAAILETKLEPDTPK
jgi:hypothetical protein